MLRCNVALVTLLIGAHTASAQDVIRLGGTAPAADTFRLDVSSGPDADIDLVAYRGGYGGYRGGYAGYRGGYGGYRGGFAGYYGGYRGGYAGFRGGYGGYRGGYYSHYGYGHRYGWGGYYRPYAYSSYYYRPYVYPSFYYGPTYSAPTYFYYPSPYFIDPCAADGPVTPDAITLGSGFSVLRSQPIAPRSAPANSGNGTYYYDGGPRQQIPLTDAVPATKPPSPAPPRDQKLVTLPSTSKYTYAAYGETTPNTTLPPSDLWLVSGAALPPPQFSAEALGSR